MENIKSIFKIIKSHFETIQAIGGGAASIIFFWYVIKIYFPEIMSFYDSHHIEISIYVYGVVITFSVSMISTTISAIGEFSTVSRNMKKIGKRLSWASGNYQDIKVNFDGIYDDIFFVKNFGSFIKKYFIFIISMSICSLMISWLGVLGYLFWIIKLPFVLIGRMMMPEDVKSARWRLQNNNLDFDGVLKQLSIINGVEVDISERSRIIESLLKNSIIDDFDYRKLTDI
jgi:hypothetical protein